VLSHEENELITRVGPRTPLGEMFRRYWVPACLSEEVAEPDCDPIRVRLLGEDLVAFRDTSGRTGLLAERCPHRLASLWLGRNEEGGLRCIYHGWKYDVEGTVLDMPCEPIESAFKDRVRQVAYPTHEAGDVVWAYMGPRDRVPPFADFEWSLVPGENRSIAKVQEECNYLQGIEGTVDSSHGDVLHSGLQKLILRNAELSQDTVPRFEIEDTPYGFRYAAIRTPVDDADRYLYVRTTCFIFPFYNLVPPRGFGHMHMFVPIDDERTWDYSIYFSASRRIDHAQTLARRYSAPGVDLLPDRRKIRGMENRFLQDREGMQAKTTFTGIPGNTNEDMAVRESMGGIVDRSQEHLGASDAVVVHARRLLLDTVRAFVEGADPPGLGADLRHDRIQANHKLLPVELPWQQIGEYPDKDLVAEYARAGVPAE